MILKSKLFWSVALAAAVIFFLIGINSKKQYIGETDILVLAKSEKTSRNISQIIEDVKAIPESLKFYEIMLQKNSEIEDQFGELPDFKRKKMWNEQLEIRQKNKGGVLAVQVMDPSQLQAYIISEQAAKDITAVMGRYYDAKTELEIRLIDGPIVKQTSNAPGAGMIALNVILGLLAGLAVYFLFETKSAVQFAMRAPKLQFPASAGKTERLEQATRESREDMLKNTELIREPAAAINKKSSAPENLPIGENFVISSLKRAEKAAKKEEEEKAGPKTHEATEEEIRDRLNKLLGGKM